MKYIKLFIILSLFLTTSKINAQQHYGNITSFEILPAYLSNNKVLLSSTNNTTNIQFKVSFSRVSTTYPNWKPFNMKVMLGSYKTDSYGSVIGIDYFSPAYEVKSSDFPTNPNLAFLDKTFNAVLDKTVLTDPSRKIILFYQTVDMTQVSYFNVMYNFVIEGAGTTPNPGTPSNPGTGPSRPLSTMVGIDIAGDDHVYYWDSNSIASSGYSTSLQDYRTPYGYYAATGKNVSSIVSIAIGSSDWCYAWYNDGTVSAGYSNQLDMYLAPTNFVLPSGKVVSDIVGITINRANNYCYTFYKDGTASAGTPTNLGLYTTSFNYSISPDETYDKILDVGIAPSSGKFYVWFSDNKMSVGSATNLSDFVPLKPMN